MPEKAAIEWVADIGVCMMQPIVSPMFAARRPAYVTSALLAATLTACTFSEPKSDDPTSILGCYTAPNAPAFRLVAEGMQFDRSQLPVPFRYEFRKSGYVLDLPLSANEVDGRLAFSPGEGHLYPVVPTEAGPTIRVAFGPSARLVNYRRSAAAGCL